LRLSQVNADVGQLDAIFFTHMHSEWEELMGGLRRRARRSYAQLIQTASSTTSIP
jgi:hypothetical protein